MLIGTLKCSGDGIEEKISVIGKDVAGMLRLDFYPIFGDTLPSKFTEDIDNNYLLNPLVIKDSTYKFISINLSKKARTCQITTDSKSIFKAIAIAIKTALNTCGILSNRTFVEKSKEVYCYSEDYIKFGNISLHEFNSECLVDRTEIKTIKMSVVISNLKFELSIDEDATFSTLLKSIKSYEHTTQVNNIFNKNITVDQLNTKLQLGVSSTRSLLVDLNFLLKKKGISNWSTGRKRKIIKNISEFLDMLADLSSSEGRIGLDFETTGLRMCYLSRIRHEKSNRVTGFVIGSEFSDIKYYVPLFHTELHNIFSDIPEDMLDGIKDVIKNSHYPEDVKNRILDAPEENNDWIAMAYLQPLISKRPLINANIQFDWKCCYIYYILANYVDDTQIAALLMKHKYHEFGYKELTKTILNITPLDLDDFSPTGNWSDLPITFRDLPEDYVYQYVFPDVENLFPIIEHLKNELAETDQQFIYELEVMFARVAAYQEFFGYNIPLEEIDTLKNSLEQDIEKYANIIYELTGKTFNIDSPDQLLEVLQGLGYELDATNKEALEQQPEDDPIIQSIRSYRKVSHAHKLFVKPMIDPINPQVIDTGDIFSSTFTLGTATGRASASNPNYMQADKNVKAHIKAREGFSLADLDLSQIEYRVIAWLSEQPELLKMFEDAYKDYHTAQASNMFSILYELITYEMRKGAKGINFGLPFGMGDASLGYRIFGKRTSENTAKAKMYRKLYFKNQKKVLHFFESTRDNAVRDGFTRTAFGRRRYYDFERKDIGKIRREAGNARIQGTAADIYKIGVVRFFLKLIEYDLLELVRILGFIHDEILIEYSTKINPYFIQKLLRESFEQAPEGCCPIYSGIGFGTSWAEAKDDKNELDTIVGHELMEKADTLWWKESKHYRTDKTNPEIFKEEIHKYKKKLIVDYIINPDNYGKPIKAHIYKALSEHFKPANVDSKKITLKMLLDAFIEKYAPDVIINEGDIIDPATIKQEEKHEILIENDEEISIVGLKPKEFLIHKGYYVSQNAIQINLATLPKSLFEKLKDFLTAHNSNENNCDAILCFYDGEVERFIAKFKIPIEARQNLIQFTQRAFIPIINDKVGIA